MIITHPVFVVGCLLLFVALQFSIGNAQENRLAGDVQAFTSPDKYRIVVVKARSSENAKKIARLLNNMIDKAVFIETDAGYYEVQIGGIDNLNEAEAIQRKLQNLGLHSSSIRNENDNKNDPTPDDTLTDFSSDKTLQVSTIQSPIIVDGTLDEAAWRDAIPAGGFIQQQPFDRQPATEQTEIRILVDNENLYLGITCFDSKPDRIVATEMRRDARLFQDDNLEIFIDTFDDNKNCYYFQTNSAGAKYDALVTDEGTDINDDWNTIWQCKVDKNGKGWSVEIAIPFSSIRYEEALDTWGLNVGRQVQHNREQSFWSYIPRGLGRMGKYRVSRFGRMTGLRNVGSTKNIEIIPYATGGSTKEYETDAASSEFDGGFDLQYRITSNLRADFSVNTDFAQVESDREVVNVSRFNLFFPEKRDFFLENAGLMQFGDVGFYSSYLLYHSRRIGIQNEEEIPLFGGTKFTGKIGSANIGVMSIQTRDKTLSDDTVVPSTNFSVLRMKYDLLKNSNFGIMFLNKQDTKDHYNRSVGIDGYFPISTALTAGGSLAKTFTPDISGKDYAGVAYIDLRSDRFSGNIKYRTLGDNFNPEMGFIRREKVRSLFANARLTKWINGFGIRNINLSSNFSHIMNNHNTLESRRYSGELDVSLDNGDDFEFEVEREDEFLAEPDDIQSIVIPSDTYSFTTYKLEYTINHSRVLSGRVEYSFGDFFGGKRRTFEPHYHFRPNAHINLETFYTYNHIELPNGNLYSNVLTNRIAYMFSPDFFVKAFIQWNDRDDRLSSNILFQYLYKSANEFYIVYNESRDPDARDIPLRDRILQFKFVYHFFI